MEWLWIVLWAAVKWIGLVLLFVMPVASLLTWAERRQSAMMQDRLGPNRANIGPIKLWGILHFVADALKMLFKEDFVPARAHRILFLLAPLLAIAPVFIAFALIPFGPPVDFGKLGEVLSFTEVARDGTVLSGERLQVLSVEFGLLFYFAIASLANYGATLAGWSSYNKWALLGGLRASSQMMAYEVAMGLSIMGMFLVAGSLEPGAIVGWQVQHTWGVVVQPLACLLFFIAAIAETKRAPFDLPEGEPEIIGYFVEYSGMRFGIFFLAEFIEVVFVAAIMVTVFFGGWEVPFLSYDGWHFPWINVQSLWPHGLVVLTQVLFWTLKVIFFCWLQLLIRWTLPRFRPDQLMALGWTKLLPLALLNIMITALVIMWTKNEALGMAHGTHEHEEETHDPDRGGPVVVSVSAKNPRVRTVRLERGALGIERTFLPAVLVGLGVTARHFFRNVFARKDTATIEYPDVKPAYPERFRGVHRLMHREDGSVRCVACMLCPTVCPAHCITIHPAERNDSNEKYPAIFEIDELKCVVCGLCVEACPCDAIRMDTGIHMPPSTTRGDAVLGKVDLMKHGTQSTAVQGGVGRDWDKRDDVPERGPGSRVPAAPR